jgi:hypothetical protein
MEQSQTKRKPGRPKFEDGKKSITLQFRIPETVYKAIPEPKSEWVRNYLLEHFTIDSKV